MRYRFITSLFALLLILAGCSSDDSTTASDDADASGESGEIVAGTETDAGEDDADAAEEGDDTAEDTEGEDTADADADSSDDPVAIEPGTTVRLITHDSFSVSDGLFENFTIETGIDVELVKGGDAGELVARAVLTSDVPEADVLYGIDNTFLQRGLDGDIFIPHESPALASVPDQLELDPEFRVTPINFGDVCVNYWIDQVDQVPTGLDDLTDPAVAASFVTENPETSSPGFAFLLATIAKYGEDGWEDYWQQLADGGVTVTAGWEDAYYGEFIAGGGENALVTSYASSPVAEVLFAAEPIDTPPTGVIEDSCFRQVEFAGILAGTEVPDAAALLIDFMLSETFQADIPLNMFVAPANEDVALPELYEAHATIVDSPLTLTPAEIEANRNDWTERWAEIVLRG